MSRHLNLRVSQAEMDFLDRLATEKGVTRTAVARHLLLQNLALDAIKTEVASVLSLHLADVRGELGELRQQVEATASFEDLKKATNYLAERVKKGVQK